MEVFPSFALFPRFSTLRGELPALWLIGWNGRARGRYTLVLCFFFVGFWQMSLGSFSWLLRFFRILYCWLFYAFLGFKKALKSFLLLRLKPPPCQPIRERRRAFSEKEKRRTVCRGILDIARGAEQTYRQDMLELLLLMQQKVGPAALLAPCTGCLTCPHDATKGCRVTTAFARK